MGSGSRIAQVVSTAIMTWDVVPDVYCDAVSDQEEVMAIICNAKGAMYDGVDCVGELDDSPVTVSDEVPVVDSRACGRIFLV